VWDRLSLLARLVSDSEHKAKLKSGLSRFCYFRSASLASVAGFSSGTRGKLVFANSDMLVCARFKSIAFRKVFKFRGATKRPAVPEVIDVDNTGAKQSRQDRR